MKNIMEKIRKKLRDKDNRNVFIGRLAVVVFVLVLVALSFVKFFPVHAMSLCPGDDESMAVNGPVRCPRQANFWQYISSDLRPENLGR
ncbi:hypothetical protein FWH09_01935 [Candidatus Saccharibacteria bacterium]|nr:hypothetical protein [Candidatus Saccharibacteria bacterium]